MIRLAKSEKITSVADFLAARYGKSFAVASIATIIATVGAIPYIALQLKAISGSVSLMVEHYSGAAPSFDFFIGDSSLAVAFLLVDDPGQNQVDPGIVADLKQLGLSAIEEAEGEVRVVIGGTLDNTVGFLKPGPSGPPAISPSEYIWLENVGNGWFLCRTA